MESNNAISPLSGVDFVRNSSKLSPISHLGTRELFVLKTFIDDFGTVRKDSPNSELGFRTFELKDGEMDGEDSTGEAEC